jgi:hypothetical protein
MQEEAQRGLLRSLVALGDAAATLTLLDEIEDNPAFSGRRAEMQRLRAESLVKLNRCEEALLQAEELPAKSAADIRRSCRDQRKETPP